MRCLPHGTRSFLRVAATCAGLAGPVLGSTASVVHAQVVAAPPAALDGTERGLSVPMPSLRGVLVTGTLLLGGLAIAAQDERWAERLQRPRVQGNGALSGVSPVIRTVGDPGALALSAGAYVVGRIGGRPGLADAGLHATEAILVSGALSGVVKGIVGRARPYAAGPDGPGEFGPEAEEFRFGDGRGAYTSFPSGHTTAAFAAASAVTAELSVTHPRAARVAGPLLYGGATFVGLSRMYDNKHWASDVVAGAAIGTLVGRAVVRYQHGHPGNRLDRWLLPSSVAPTPGGATIAWTIPTP